MTSITDKNSLSEFAAICPYCKSRVERGLVNMGEHFAACPKYPRISLTGKVTVEDWNNLMETIENNRESQYRKIKMQVGWNYVELMIEKYGEQKTAEYLKLDADLIELVLNADTWKKWQDFAMRNGLMETK